MQKPAQRLRKRTESLRGVEIRAGGRIVRGGGGQNRNNFERLRSDGVSWEIRCEVSCKVNWEVSWTRSVHTIRVSVDNAKTKNAAERS